MHSPGINVEGELRGQPANPGLRGKMAVKTECVCTWTGSSLPAGRQAVNFHKVDQR